MASSPQCSTPVVGILSLPNEVLDQIVDDLSQDDPTSSHEPAFDQLADPSAISNLYTDRHGIFRDKQRRHDLASVCRSCKRLAALATPRLYSRVWLSRSTAGVLSLDPAIDEASFNSIGYSSADDQVLSADTPPLLLRTLIEGANDPRPFREMVTEINVFLLLRQQCLYLQEGVTVNDPRAITAGWLRIAPTIRLLPAESYEARVLDYVGLSSSLSPESQSTQDTMTTDIPERIIAAILLLCTRTQSTTLLCPPWHWTSAPACSPAFSEPGYTVLDDLLRGVLGLGQPMQHSLTHSLPFQHLENVTFTGMGGLESLGRIDTEDLLFGNDPCPGSYIARGDSCPALAYAPGLRKVTTHGTRGGWYEMMNEKIPDDAHDTGRPQRTNQGQEDRRQQRADKDTKLLTSVHISSLTPDHDLIPFFRLGAFDDLARLAGLNDTMEDMTIEQTVPCPPLPPSSKPSSPLCGSSSTAQETGEGELRRAPPITSSNVLSPGILDSGLSRHALSLRKLDLSGCWHLVDSVAGMDSSGGPRPLRVLGLLTGLEELIISLPLLATNAELWRFYLLGVDDIGWTARVAESMARFTDVVGEVLASEEVRTNRRAEILEMAGYVASEASQQDGWEYELPFLRNIPASVKHLRITDRVELPRCAYWAREGEYGSGHGIPDFEQLHDQDSDVTGDAKSVGQLQGDSTLTRLEDFAIAQHHQFLASGSAEQVGQQSGLVTADPTPRVEFAHKYLLPLCLKRLAEVCWLTHPDLESVTVCADRQLLSRRKVYDEGERVHRPDEMLYGAEELEALFVDRGLTFDVVYQGV